MDWNAHVWTMMTSLGGGRCHWVSMCTVWLSHSKWLSDQSNKSASNFALSLNIPLWKLFRWFRRPQLRATGDWQLHHNNTHTHVSQLVQSFGERSNPPGESAPLQPRFGALRLLAFPKTKITFESGETSDCWVRFRKIIRGSWWRLGELCEVPRCLLWRGLRCHCPVYNVSWIFFHKCHYFSY